MSQLNRIIELIRLTNQPGFILEGEREPLVVLPLTSYESLVANRQPVAVSAETWSQALQQQIDLLRQGQQEVKTSKTTVSANQSAPIIPNNNSILQNKPDLSEVMEEEIPEEYLPEPLDS